MRTRFAFARTADGKPDYSEDALEELASDEKLPISIIREAERALITFAREVHAECGGDFYDAAKAAVAQRPNLAKVARAERAV